MHHFATSLTKVPDHGLSVQAGVWVTARLDPFGCLMHWQHEMGGVLDSGFDEIR